MTRLAWGAVGERTYEGGVDRGVLYVDGLDGVPWNGLVSINEAPSGGEATPHYLDGVNYHNRVSVEEFRATIEAFTYPEEFMECDGTSRISRGLFAAHQPRKTFGLTYRTLIGNDIEGFDYGYKIHFVYNCVVTPSSRANKTLSNNPEISNFSWSVVSKPPALNWDTSTAHFIIDSREVTPDFLAYIENTLYGTASNAPRLPSPHELIYYSLFEPNEVNAGYLYEPHYLIYDGGHPPGTVQSQVIDSGSLNAILLTPGGDGYDSGELSASQSEDLDGGDPPSTNQSSTVDSGFVGDEYTPIINAYEGGDVFDYVPDSTIDGGSPPPFDPTETIDGGTS